MPGGAWPLSLAAGLTVTAGLAISGWLLLRGGKPALSRATSFALVVLALGQAAVFAPRPDWLQPVADFLLPSALFWVAAAMVGTPGSRERGRAVWRSAAVTCVCMAALVATQSPFVQTLEQGGRGPALVRLGPWGRPVYGLLVILLVFGVAQFESLLRAMAQRTRYSMKFLLLGLCIPATYEILLTSQILLLGVAPLDRGVPSGIVALVAVGLVALAFWRARVDQPGAIYVSPDVLYGSATFLVIGLYLLAVGAAGEFLRRSWPVLGSDLSAVLVLLALAGLAAAALSRGARAGLRRVMAKGMYRSKYDYRAMWIEVTDAFQSVDTFDGILDRLLEVLSRTFAAGRLSVFVRFDVDGGFHQVRSVNTERAPPVPEGQPLLEVLGRADYPIDAPPDAVGPEWRDATHAVLLAPIRSGGSLLGFVTLGPAAGGYATDDRNLLRAITLHVGVLLSYARLAEERRGAAEIEALHRVSAFCVHDLKNLAASLALVARNAESHGQDPAFQESALRTVARTADKIMGLVQRLSRRSADPVPEDGPVDVRALVEETIAALDGSPRIDLAPAAGDLPRVRAARNELQQVVLNLVLNAREATPAPSGTITAEHAAVRVRTSGKEGQVEIEVSDRGPGLSPEALQRLFEPFRSTKDGGFGLGLYECRRIVEGLGGRIRVTSEPGRGTTFRVQFPGVASASPVTGTGD